MTEIYQDFLPDPLYRVIRDLFMTEKIAWHYNDRVTTRDQHYMFTHTFMNDGQVINPYFFEPVRQMVGLIQARRRFIGVTRIKANLYTNQGEVIEHPPHFDIPPESGLSEKYLIGVYHVNACNGCTIIGDEKIKSEDNQLVLFDNQEHYGTTQTDTDTRVVINFNLRVRE